MKKFLAFLLPLTMVFAMAAVAFAEGETYLWDNFDDRDRMPSLSLRPTACTSGGTTGRTCAQRMRTAR